MKSVAAVERERERERERVYSLINKSMKNALFGIQRKDR